jgi:FMN phosphatase YigB (HAD superfamily)
MRVSGADKVIFLLDVDNTLIDNDRIERDLNGHLGREFGTRGRDRYWKIFEGLRTELGYADYLGALQRYRLQNPDNPRLLLTSAFLLDYPFAERLFPRALDAIAHLRQWGRTVILSDGDVVFQPRKVQRSGLWSAIGGNVLIYVHKEQMLAAVARRYPAMHYVVVDDKPPVLKAMKGPLGRRLTTVLPEQGHYALDAEIRKSCGPPDLTVASIGDLIGYDLQALLAAAKRSGQGAA